MFHRTLRLLAAFGALAAASVTAAAPIVGTDSTTATTRTPQVTTTLVSSHTQLPPGGTLTIGIRQELAPHWHTYWINPGDSGMATQARWTLPPDWEAGTLRWPAPRRIDVGPVVNHGYEDRSTLLVDITVPRHASVGQTVPIRLDLSWLVCQDTCIPQQATLSVPVTVGPRAIPIAANQAALQEAGQQLPQPVNPPLRALHADQGILVELPGRPAPGITAQFFAEVWGVVRHDARPVTHQEEGRWWLLVPHGEAARRPGEPLAGVLRMGDTGFAVSTALQAAPAAWASRLPWSRTEAGAAGGATSNAEKGEEGWTLLLALGLAWLGGLALNLMPCVFPVLSIKALSLLQHPERTRRERLQLALAYTAGVVISFLALATLLLVLQATGHEAGWGFQFQNPHFVLLLSALLFVVGLNLLGVFEVGQRLTGVGSKLASRSGMVGSFFTGVLATVVATPCTAPFMAGAIGYALSQPPLVVWGVFAALGLGLATPYVLLSSWPALQRRLPRPGVWMLHVKQLLAFPMFASAVWLVWVLAQQTGPDGVAVALGSLVVTGLAAWVWGLTQLSRPSWARQGRWLATVLVMTTAATAWQSLAAVTVPAASNQPGTHVTWEPFATERLEALRSAGQPVFVNFTAAWCITCLLNERTALSTDPVQSAFHAHGVTYLKGDWTQQDPEITRVLQQHGRSGVPLYLYFPGERHSPPIVLPQLLTPGIVIDVIAAHTGTDAVRP